MTGTKVQYLGLPGTDNNRTKEETARSPPTRSRKALIALLGLTPSFVLLSLLLALCLAGIRFSQTRKDYGCDPDGNVWVTNANRPNVWAKNYGLAITLGWGQMSFSTAKSIDVIWDLVVSRGIQVLLAAVIYLVFRGPVVSSMHHYAVSYEKVLQMQYNTAGFTALLTYAKDVHWKNQSARQFWMAFALVFSTLYALILPTLTSAMTGYQAIMKPLLELQNGTFIEFSELEQCSYVIEDGKRLGLGVDACVQSRSQFSNAVAGYIGQYVDYNYTGGWTGNASPAQANNVSSSVVGPDGQTHNLGPPLLNITQNSFEDAMHAVYYDGRELSADTLTSMGMCAPQSTYRWGFSLILLFMFLSVTWFFSLFLYWVWLRSYWRTAQTDGEGEMFGSLRAAISVASSIQDEIGEQAAAQMPNKRLKHVLKQRRAGVRVRGEDDVKMLRLRSNSELRTTDSGRLGASRQSSYHGRSASAHSFT